MSAPAVIPIEPADLPAAVDELTRAGGRMQFAYAWHPQPGQIELRYVADLPERKGLRIWRTRPGGAMPSAANASPLLGWYEREVSDLFGVVFEGHPEPDRLVLHEGAEPAVPPFDPTYPAGTAMPFAARGGRMPEVVGPDVQQLPFGPIRADVVESVELTFLYVGEHILHLHPQLFFKHRGMEKRFEGLPLARATTLAERVSGIGSFAHALAFCQAVEQAAGCAVPERARLMRSLLAELERIYNHLHYLGHLADTTTLKVGQAEGKLLEERAKQLNGRLTGSRFLRGLVTPGGLRRDLDPGAWLSEELDRLRADAAAYAARLDNTPSYLDRLITTGPLSHRLAFDQGATGPVERASGLNRDLRRDYPYAGYADLAFEVPVLGEGDAYARAQVRIVELMASIALVQSIVARLADGPVRSECVPAAGSEGLGWTEVAARRALLRRSFRCGRRDRPHQDQVAIVLQLARVSVHRPRKQHDGLRHQRSELRPQRGRLRSIGAGMPNWTLLGLRQGQATTSWPRGDGSDGQQGVLGMPRFAPDRCRSGCAACADSCPTEAIGVAADIAGAERLTVDYGRCIACQLCVEACPADAVSTSFDWAFGVRERGDLMLDGKAHPATAVTAAPRTAFRRSLHVRHVDAGSCNGCESELQALNNPFYNLHRLGIFFTPSPRFADLLLVTGPVTTAMRGPLTRAYEAMPEPRWVMAVGTCAVSAALTGGGYTGGNGLDDVLPVDLYLPGSPPNPAAIIEALLMFLDRMPQRVRGGRLGA